MQRRRLPRLVGSAAPVAASQSVDDFYRMRNGAPLWLVAEGGRCGRAAGLTAQHFELDGLDPERYHVAALQQALASGARWASARMSSAPIAMLSEAFVAYVPRPERDPGLGILYVDPALQPTPPSPLAALLGAANAPSLSTYVRDMGWMNPIYGELRQALANHRYASRPRARSCSTLNLQRARVLPAGKQRYILVNAAQQRLYTYEDGKQVDSMVVVVGKPKYPTPMMTAYVRFAASTLIGTCRPTSRRSASRRRW